MVDLLTPKSIFQKSKQRSLKVPSRLRVRGVREEIKEGDGTRVC